MKVGVPDEVAIGIQCSLMKPNEFDAFFWERQLIQMALIDRGQKLIPEVPSVVLNVGKILRCWSPLDHQKPRGRMLVPLMLNGFLDLFIERS